MLVAVISDTHVPERAAEIPEAFRERIRTADHVVHAGDFETVDALETVRDLAPELTAVHGNMDPADIGLPSVATVEAGGVTFVVSHATVRSRDEWFDHVASTAREEADEPRVGIGGHTHRVEDAVHDGVRVLNPGSVTGAAPAERTTMMTVEAENGGIDVTVHEV